MDNRDLDRQGDDVEDTSARQPWTGLEAAQTPTVQLGMLLLLMLLALIVLWITWSLVTSG